MDYAETRTGNRTSWQGIDLILTKPAPNLTLLTAENNHDGDYTQAISTITDLNRLAIAGIQSMHLPQFKTKAPNFACAVIPAFQFLQATGIPNNYSWATICSRGIWRPEREDAVVVSSDHAKKIGFTADANLGELTEQQIDLIRENEHEYMPTVRDTYLSYPSASALPISEAMDEVVPRIILGLQKYMPQSTQFLKGLQEKDILTVEDLWEGFSKHSSNPISTNPAYASAFLFGAGLMQRFQTKYGLNKDAALSLWLNTMIEAENGRNVVKRISEKLELPEAELWTGKKLQMEGIEII